MKTVIQMSGWLKIELKVLKVLAFGGDGKSNYSYLTVLRIQDLTISAIKQRFLCDFNE